MATVWATGVVVPVINGQGLRLRAAAAKKQPPKGGKQQQKAQKSEGKGFFDRILEWLDKESFSETDPLLNKTGENNKGVSVAPPPQKKGGFFGLN